MVKSDVNANASRLDQANYFTRIGKVQDYLKGFSRDSKILELGTGRGRLTSDLLEMGFNNLTLVDVENYTDSYKVELVDLSFNKLPYDDNNFDILLAIAIAEHLENPFLFFRECSRVIKSGGIFILAIPHALSFKSKINFVFSGDLIGYRKDNNHISVFTRSIFEKIVLKDFAIKEIFFDPGYIKIFNKKIRFNKKNKWFGKLFGDKVLYILNKK